jgi:hypothetical protein
MNLVGKSRIVCIKPSDENQVFECGTPFWVLFDILNLSILPPFRERVFYLRRVANEVNSN